MKKKTSVIREGFTGSVYRFFDKEEFADKFCEGLFRISTLEACRGYENPEQGDKEEGAWRHTINSVQISKASEVDTSSLLYAGVRVDPSATNVVIRNVSGGRRIENAYLLCTTKVFNPDIFSDSFGKYCVEISNAQCFTHIVTKAIHKHHSKLQWVRGEFGDVTYIEERHGVDFEKPNGHIGFLKPKDPYITQKEFRFLWELSEPYLDIEPLNLNIPDISKFCKRIL